MKHLILSLVLVTSIANVAKAQFDDYKYIVIPELFDGFDKNNQHQTNSLVKHLFDKNGFNTAYGGNLPADLQQNACLGLYVQLVDRSTMFTTKTTLVLKDCNGSEVFSSLQGRSKEKDYKVSYGNAIRDAFRSFEGIKHSYVEKTPATSEEPVVISFKDDVKKLDQPNRGRQPDPMVEQETSEERQYYRDRRPVPSDFKKAETKEVQKESIDQVATPEEQRYEAITPVESDIQKEEPTVQKTTPPLTMLQDFGVLYAQELPNGFQLVDSTPKIQMKLRKSSSPNVFFAEADDTNGVVFSQAGKWIFEYYYQDQLVSKELNIKF